MYKCSNNDLRNIKSISSTKKLSRCCSFHFRYLELCRAKNLTPLPDIKMKKNSTNILDFYGDKLCVNDWLLVVASLNSDQVLQTLAIRMRKAFPIVLELLDTEKKAKLFRQKPVIFTKFVFSGVVEALSNCIEVNKNLRVLSLEGLPLNEKYVESVAKALSSNKGLQDISFQRSNIGDKGCEVICNAVKYLENVEKLNLSECNLTSKGAEFVADMLKIQKITHFTEGWQKSLRYGEVDPDAMHGLRCLKLAGNQQIGDEGLKAIVEELKENICVKFLDMENCGLTDVAVNLILDCLELNNGIEDFKVANNMDMNKFLQRRIREQLGQADEDQQLMMQQQQHSKMTLAGLREQLKTLQKQLEFERELRQNAECLNAKLNQQIFDYEAQLQREVQSNLPEGYVIVREESLQSLISERNHFQKMISSNEVSEDELMPSHDISRPVTPTQDGATELSTIANGNELCAASTMSCHAVGPRKVKSEMRYNTPPSRGSSRRKISKSDHEISNESENNMPSSVHIERNIGDTLSNITNMSTTRTTNCSTNRSTITASTVIEKRPQFQSSIHSNLPPNGDEFDSLSMSIASSVCSDTDDFTDLDTLRNQIIDHQPMELFLQSPEQTTTMPLTPMPQCPEQLTKMPLTPMPAKIMEKKPKTNKREKSPRSLFFGTCDD
uniref:Uncharacterized protein n=1 Tax=Stomoxys calcitrans TaxID=35570 RepID=A0A1I8NX28_STOCA